MITITHLPHITPPPAMSRYVEHINRCPECAAHPRDLCPDGEREFQGMREEAENHE